jgi:anti-sigma B factor antagonist
MSERFDLQRTVEGDRARVTASGEVDLFTAPELKAGLRYVILEAGATDVTVDLTGATFLDSTGIAALFGAYRWLRARDGKLAILADDPAIVEPLELTGLTEFVALMAA